MLRVISRLDLRQLYTGHYLVLLSCKTSSAAGPNLINSDPSTLLLIISETQSNSSTVGQELLCRSGVSLREVWYCLSKSLDLTVCLCFRTESSLTICWRTDAGSSVSSLSRQLRSDALTVPSTNSARTPFLLLVFKPSSLAPPGTMTSSYSIFDCNLNFQLSRSSCDNSNLFLGSACFF